ncbi:MAG: cell division transporter substrate-binding protein FtsY [Gemmatimonadales bacterium]|jgi:fused signal recognition particle receptor|nr:cell division transporter substrate-binding protein FtsY [Gemmatimonadales bacterium]
MPGRIVRRTGDLPARSLWTRIKDVALTDVTAVARSGAIQGSLEKMEEVLLEADFGVPTTMRLVAEIEADARRGLIKTQDQFLGALRAAIETSLRSGNSDPRIVQAKSAPTVILVVGVNGAGKTTFIGKFSDLLKRNKMSALVGAADTFRAGAIDQLRSWAERTGADFVGGNAGSDPASVAFDAVDAGVNRNKDVVIVDTAGRLHTSGSLMDEMKKINRVIGKRLPSAPHETLLVLDGTIGQNAVMQAKTFAEAIPVTGLVVTKVDGTAKGGIVLAVHEALDIPVKFIGMGEKVTDLVEFDPAEFARQVLEG